MVEYWPWWAGALGLAAAALSHLFLLRKPLGVSGAYARMLAFSTERAAERAETAAFADGSLRRALIAETVADMRASGVPAAEVDALEQQALAEVPEPAPSKTPVSAQLVFLVCMVLGALVSSAFSGRLSLQWLPDGLHPALFGRGVGLAVALFGGGLLVGAGTRIAGGCTSGHGLSGCARLQPASFAATALFMGAGVLASFALVRVLT